MAVVAEGSSWDEAIARLEEVLARHPFDRALPPLDDLLAAADLDRSIIEVDERVRKILDEAVLARPLSTLDAVAAVRTEVEVLAVEIGMLVRQLEKDALTDDQLGDAGQRLSEIRALLDEVGDTL